MTEPMRISPRYNVDHWAGLAFATEQDWQEAINIFEDRIRGRFLEIIDRVEDEEFAGFAVMALDCLLIETLQQFREGSERTPPNKSCRYFVEFLTQTSFKDYFTTEDMAEVFYDQIRCGILHQAETKGNSRLVIRPDVALVSPTADGEGLIINRRLFHEQLVRVFEEYVSSLRDASDSELRKNFKHKMDYICRATPREQ